MIIIPEIRSIYIRIPSNEDGKLSAAIMRKYPKARELYKQMEHDGIPFKFRHFEKFSVIRDPIDRLWDFYNRHLNREADLYSLSVYRENTKRYYFRDWLMLNNACFEPEISPSKTREYGTLYNENSIIHHIPENQKSQYFYLTPGLEMFIIPYPRINDLAQALGIDEDVTPDDKYGPAPELESTIVQSTMDRLFAWDRELYDRMQSSYLEGAIKSTGHS